MKFAEFTAVCPYELDDLLYISGVQEWVRIEDIICTHYVRSGHVAFQLVVTSVKANGIMKATVIQADSKLILKTIRNQEAEARKDEWSK